MVEVKPNINMSAPRAWPPGHKYGYPCRCRQFPEEKRVKYVQPERAVSFKPCKIYRSPEARMPDNTTYKQSYEAFEPSMLRNCKGRPLLAKENLTPAGDFSDLTTHKMSYGAWPGVTRQKIYYPRDHRLAGEGPMAEVTTQKHDYTPKCIDTPPKIIRPNNLGFSSAPMADSWLQKALWKVIQSTNFHSCHLNRSRNWISLGPNQSHTLDWGNLWTEVQSIMEVTYLLEGWLKIHMDIAWVVIVCIRPNAMKKQAKNLQQKPVQKDMTLIRIHPGHHLLWKNGKYNEAKFDGLQWAIVELVQWSKCQLNKVKGNQKNGFTIKWLPLFFICLVLNFMDRLQKFYFFMANLLLVMLT